MAAANNHQVDLISHTCCVFQTNCQHPKSPTDAERNEPIWIQLIIQRSHLDHYKDRKDGMIQQPIIQLPMLQISSLNEMTLGIVITVGLIGIARLVTEAFIPIILRIIIDFHRT